MRIGYTIRNKGGHLIARVGAFVRGFHGEPTGTINQAEYLGVIHALRHAIRLGFTEAICRVDSQLLARQLSGAYKVRDPKLARLHREIKEIGHFIAVEIVWQSREKNAEADALAKQTVFEVPAETIERGGGRRPRSLPPWLAARARRWADQEIGERGRFNAGTLTRVLGCDHTTLRQILRGETYRNAIEGDVPNWDRNGVTLCSTDPETAGCDGFDSPTHHDGVTLCSTDPETIRCDGSDSPPPPSADATMAQSPPDSSGSGPA